MKIVADSGLFGIEELVAQLEGVCELQLLSGRDISPAQLRDAEALLVRSITPVNEALLEGSQVRFVGTATSGVNHIDTVFLGRAAIQLVDAKGANAAAVVDYVFAALALLACETALEPEGKTIGIVGHGCVGSLLDQTLQAAGFVTACCDDPLAAQLGSESSFVDLATALACPIVCVHVPLSGLGEFATRNLIGREELSHMAENAVLINPSRGGVVDEQALKHHLQSRPCFIYAADVWRDEPDVDAELVGASWLATPHIAGYSVQAKQTATAVLLAELSRYARAVEKIEIAVALNSAAEHCLSGIGEAREVSLESGMDSNRGGLWPAIVRLLDLRAVDKSFRCALRGGMTAEKFDRQRQPLLKRQQLSLARVATDGVALSKSERDLAAALQLTLKA